MTTLKGTTQEEGVLTFEMLSEQFENAKNAIPQPTYIPLPDNLVEESLKLGIIPQFVIVTPRGKKMIDDYAKEHEG